MDSLTRCEWLDDSKLYTQYHDQEWGVPQHEDNKLFEMLLLESFQAGLSWITVLKKREHFRIAFDNFSPKKISMYDESKVDQLVNNATIIRSRAKIIATINNAKLFLELQDTHGSFDKFIWSYVDHSPIISNYSSLSELPAYTELSTKISKDLKKIGFKFVGPTIIYAYMQAIGMVNDHTKDCYLYKGEN